MITKLVESNHYHLWTDALHARQLAKQTNNKWDRGTYVRWTIITSWIALEMACQDALEHRLNLPKKDFKENINFVLLSKHLEATDWGKGLWQKIKQLQEKRINAVHRVANESDLFPDAEVADLAINHIREAIKDIYTRCNKPAPQWVDDDCDEGWTTGVMSAHGSSGGSQYRNTEGAIKVTFIHKGIEYVRAFLAPDTDIDQPLEALFQSVGKPITEVRLYRNNEIIVKYVFDQTKVRGA